MYPVHLTDKHICFLLCWIFFLFFNYCLYFQL